MGYSKTPKHSAKLSCVDFVQKRKAIHTYGWTTKGRITDKVAQKYLEDMNKSMELGGANEHLAANMSPYSSIQIVVNDGVGDVIVASYTEPLFKTI